MAAVQGTFHPAFAELADLLAKHVANGLEVGASISVWHRSENLVNIWAGYADPSQHKNWNQDTITTVFSSTKTVSALAILICHDRGLLSVFDPVSKYWPEFASNGKANILIKHLMSHTSGVAGWEEPITKEEFYDTELSTARLAEQAPWWTPGTASGYHGQNMGHLLGEIVRRVSGKSLTEFVRTEIAIPLGADVQIGALEKDWPRVAEMIPPVPKPGAGESQLEPGSIPYKVLANPPVIASNANTNAWRRTEIGAMNGHTNAQGLARALHVISNGGLSLGNKQFLKGETIDLIFETQVEGVDLVLGMPLRIGIGFGLNNDGASSAVAPYMPKGRVAFWGGYGGSMCIMDLDNKVTITYVMNKMGNGTFGNERTAEYVVLMYKALKALGIARGEIPLDARAV
jgi:CubicO group peptidase (beta-lactamase class C family)